MSTAAMPLLVGYLPYGPCPRGGTHVGPVYVSMSGGTLTNLSMKCTLPPETEVKPCACRWDEQ